MLAGHVGGCSFTKTGMWPLAQTLGNYEIYFPLFVFIPELFFLYKYMTTPEKHLTFVFCMLLTSK